MAEYDPVYLSLDDKPDAILEAMAGLVTQHDQVTAQNQRRRRLPWLFLVIGVVLIGLDYAVGFDARIFGVAGAAALVAAVVTWFVARRSRVQNISPHYGTAREVIHTLRDDLHPKGTFFGQIDLTGARQPQKLSREGTNVLGLKVHYYRDEWLGLKAKLYDGNMLRFSAIERTKERLGYYKQGSISGKQKWKPPKLASGQEIKVRISVNPEAYEVVPRADVSAGTRVGVYTIDELDTTGGIVTLLASAPAGVVGSGDILAVLKTTYSLLQRKGVA